MGAAFGEVITSDDDERDPFMDSIGGSSCFFGCD